MRPMPLLLRLSIVPAALLALSPARAADQQPYTVRIAPTPDPAVNAALAAASTLESLRAAASVGPFALISRARADQARFQTALNSEGYYAGAIAITIAAHALDDPALPPLLATLPAKPPVPVAVTAALGPRFTLGQVTLTGPIPAHARAAFTLAPGQPARAAAVLAAGAALLKTLRDDGYALATVPPPIATEHPATHTLDIAYTATPGPRVNIGPIALAGLRHVNADFVRRRLLLHQGELFNPDTIEAARQDLAALPVFAAVRVQPAPALDAAGQLPLTFDLTERLRYAVTLSAAYSTDLGGSATAAWTDRNLFGRAEQLTLSASATELGGSDATQPGYNLTATFLKPDWFRRNQSLQIDAIALKEYLDTYDRTAAILDGIVSRKLSPDLTVTAGASATQEQVTQEDVTRSYTFIGLPIGVKYDTTGSLLDPIHGLRAAATITPTESFGGAAGSATYVLLQATGSTYINLAAPGRSVLALRATMGASEGATQFGLPPDQRFYAGGSATIRGYKYQYVGPEFPNEIPQGGTALDAGTIEFRQRLGNSFGAALFVDAGQVGTTGVPFTGQFHAGAGIGGRYYTAIGPIRIDVAVPLNPQPGAGAFEAYIGIGEAF
jgi:translocation and assembly module TamA